MNNSLRTVSLIAGVALVAGCAASPQTYRTPELTKASALNNTGYERMAANDPVHAKPYFEQALAIEPTLAIAHLNLGAVYQNTGNPDAAAKEYRLAIADDTVANDYPGVLETTHGSLRSVGEIARGNMNLLPSSTGTVQ